MFIPVTIITLWALLVYGNNILERPIAAHTFTTFAVFWPSSIQGWFLWVLWGFAILSILFNGLLAPGLYMRRPTPSGSQPRRGYLTSLGLTGNLQLFDWILIGLAVALAISGWITGTAATLLLGSITALGIGLNKIEQWLI